MLEITSKKFEISTDMFDISTENFKISSKQRTVKFCYVTETAIFLPEI